MNRFIKSLVLFVMMATVSGGVGFAYAEIMGTPEDQATMVILIAVTVGSVIAPLYGYATQKPGADGKLQPFDVPQYGRALLVTFVGNLLVMVTMIEGLNIEVLTLQATIILFINAFITGVGVNALKAGASNTLKK